MSVSNKTWWAVIDLEEALPAAPYRICRWRWYAHLVAWWLDGEDNEGELYVIPWTKDH